MKPSSISHCPLSELPTPLSVLELPLYSSSFLIPKPVSVALGWPRHSFCQQPLSPVSSRLFCTAFGFPLPTRWPSVSLQPPEGLFSVRISSLLTILVQLKGRRDRLIPVVILLVEALCSLHSACWV